MNSTDRTDASRRSYRCGVCTHPRATPAQSAAYHADGADNRFGKLACLRGRGSSAAPLGRIGYSHETFMQELDAIVEHIKKSAQ